MLSKMKPFLLCSICKGQFSCIKNKKKEVLNPCEKYNKKLTSCLLKNNKNVDKCKLEYDILKLCQHKNKIIS